MRKLIIYAQNDELALEEWMLASRTRSEQERWILQIFPFLHQVFVRGALIAEKLPRITFVTKTEWKIAITGNFILKVQYYRSEQS